MAKEKSVERRTDTAERRLLAEKVQTLLDARGRTKRQLATALGRTNQNWVTHVLDRTAVLDWRDLCDMAEYFRVWVDYLYDQRVKPNEWARYDRGMPLGDHPDYPVLLRLIDRHGIEGVVGSLLDRRPLSGEARPIGGTELPPPGSEDHPLDQDQPVRQPKRRPVR